MQQRDGQMIRLECEQEVAYDSPDHIMPRETAWTDSRNVLFNRRLYQIYGNARPSILDLGCSGGGFVRDCINHGCLAIGLEGSDYSKRMKRQAWALIPDFLFTCDISKKFQLYNGKSQLLFDVITAWEVMEHIREADLETFCSNVLKHLREGGLFIISVTCYAVEGEEGHHHQTVKPIGWWEQKFKEHGLLRIKPYEAYFDGQWLARKTNVPRDGFYMVLTNAPSKSPSLPKIKPHWRLFYHWVDSFPQRLLRLLVTGRQKEDFQ